MKPLREPAITVLVISYNNRGLTLACLNSLAQQDIEEDFDIVVVDNASTDGSADAIAKQYPHVTLVRSETNAGFAGGNNLGLREVKTPWVILLNNDAVAQTDFVRTMVDATRDAPLRVAAITARVLLAGRWRPDPDGDLTDIAGSFSAADPADGDAIELVNSTGNEVLANGYGRDRGWLMPAETYHPAPDVFGFCGAAAALRMRPVDIVGGFDSDFFLYYEDTDLSWRLRLAGYRTQYLDSAVAIHAHSASTTAGSALFRYYNERNRLLLLAKNSTWPRMARQWWQFVLTTGSLMLRRRAPFTIWWTRLRAFASAVVLLPIMVKKRKRMSAIASVKRHALESELLIAD